MTEWIQRLYFTAVVVRYQFCLPFLIWLLFNLMMLSFSNFLIDPIFSNTFSRILCVIRVVSFLSLCLHAVRMPSTYNSVMRWYHFFCVGRLLVCVYRLEINLDTPTRDDWPARKAFVRRGTFWLHLWYSYRLMTSMELNVGNGSFDKSVLREHSVALCGSFMSHNPIYTHICGSHKFPFNQIWFIGCGL